MISGLRVASTARTSASILPCCVMAAGISIERPFTMSIAHGGFMNLRPKLQLGFSSVLPQEQFRRGLAGFRQGESLSIEQVLDPVGLRDLRLGSPDCGLAGLGILAEF